MSNSTFHTPVPLHIVASSILFRDMKADEIAAIFTHFKLVSYPVETPVIQRGVWHGHLYLIGSGSARIVLEEGDNNASKTIIAHLEAGDCFGEMSLITGELPSATVRVEQGAQLWSLSHGDFLQLTAAYPALLRNINHLLSLRLAQTNQHVVAARQGECVWLELICQPGALQERSLAYHIAQSLAERSHKRVLLLELVDHGQAVGSHFARHPEQVRPGLLACADSASLLQQHKAPTIDAAGRRFTALAALTDAHTAAEKREQTWNGGTASALKMLATFYDYLLVVTTLATPGPLVKLIQQTCQRAVMLVSADKASLRTAKERLSDAEAGPARAVFVAHVDEKPTIGTQDHYAAQLGLGAAPAVSLPPQLVRLLPTNQPLLEQCWEQQASLETVMPGQNLAQAADFVARYIARQTIGVAFGGGGARGFAHIGVLQRLLESNIPIDYISACSIGTIPSGLYLTGKSLVEIEEIFLGIDRLIAHWNVPRTALFSNKSLKRGFIEMCNGLRFEDLTTPFAMVAVDLATRTGVVLDRGPLWRAGLASVSLPGIFPPVIMGKHILVDAGMHDPVPVSILRKMGADILIASTLESESITTYEQTASWHDELVSYAGRKAARTPHILEMLLRSYDMAMATIGMHSVREADVAIRPDLHDVSLRHFSHGHKFVSAGYAAASRALPALYDRLPWLR